MKPMTGRERFLAALRHQESDKLPVHDGPWPTTVVRWRSEGLPADVSPADFFGFELAGYGGDNSFQFPPVTVEETDEYIINRGGWGFTQKNWKQHGSTPMLIDFPIKTRQDWERQKHRLAMNDTRVDLTAARTAMEKARQRGRFFVFEQVPGYEATWRKVSSENLLMLMATDPDWVIDMFQTDTDLICAIFKHLVSHGIKFDGGFFYDDLGYKNGLLFSPKMYREELKPCHKQITDLLHENDLPVILHTCGNVIELIPDLIEAGWDCLQPLEVKAGMDLVKLKARYGDRLSFMGGIDARNIAREDLSVVEEEIVVKFAAARKGGGYIYHSDHSIPENVSFEHFRRYWAIVEGYR